MANGQWGGLRTIRPESAVSETIDAECKVYPRLSEAWDALEWELSRSAETMGQQNRGDESLRLYVQADDPIANVPSIWVVYRVDVEVEILAVKIVPPEPEDDEDIG